LAAGRRSPFLVAAYSLPRGGQRDTRKLRAALFDGPQPERVAQLTARIEQLEAKLRAIEEHPGIDAAALRAALAHTRLIASSGGYAFAEVDAPPPAPGSRVEQGGAEYTVWRVGPSPLPGDPRRCAFLV
jgi:hypothetical protein